MHSSTREGPQRSGAGAAQERGEGAARTLRAVRRLVHRNVSRRPPLFIARALNGPQGVGDRAVGGCAGGDGRTCAVAKLQSPCPLQSDSQLVWGPAYATTAQDASNTAPMRPMAAGKLGNDAAKDPLEMLGAVRAQSDGIRPPLQPLQAVSPALPLRSGGPWRRDRGRWSRDQHGRHCRTGRSGSLTPQGPVPAPPAAQQCGLGAGGRDQHQRAIRCGRTHSS